jgi:hypothetical protein
MMALQIGVDVKNKNGKITATGAHRGTMPTRGEIMQAIGMMEVMKLRLLRQMEGDGDDDEDDDFDDEND